MRAIDVDVLEKDIRRNLDKYVGSAVFEEQFFAMRFKQFERYVKTFPVVEVEPVKHGYWIYTGEWNLPECSICRKVSHSALYGDEDAYCPCCGAEMGGAE